MPSVLSLLTPLIAACAGTAWWLARRRWPAYAPVAALLTWNAVTGLAIAAMQAWVLRPARAVLGPEPPYLWPVAAAYHVEQALELSWPMALVAAAVAVFARRRTWMPILATWAALAGGFALAYPAMRLEPRSIAHAAVHGAALAAAVALGAGSWQEHWDRRELWRAWHWALSWLWAIEFAVAVVVLWWAEPAAHWEIARRVQQVGYVALLGYHLWRIAR